MFNKIYRLFYPAKHPLDIKREHNIPDNIRLDIKLEDGWFIVTSPDLPGMVTQARNTQELLDMVNDAVLTYFDVSRREGDIVYDEINIEGHGSIRYENKYQAA